MQNGVVVFDAGGFLAEGTKVAIAPPAGATGEPEPGAGDWDAIQRAVDELEGYDFKVVPSRENLLASARMIRGRWSVISRQQWSVGSSGQ